MSRWLALGGLLIAGVALAGCGSAPLEAYPPIFGEAPWTGPERLSYNLTERDVLEGTCVLETEPNAAPGVTEIRRLCRDATEERFEDNGFARVESETLRPISSLRVIRDREGITHHYATEYADEEGVARFESREYEAEDEPPTDTLSVERELPSPTGETPQPAWYDDEELLWLVRGIPLEDGYEGSFTNVNASTGQVFPVEVTAEAEGDPIEVPAGAFATWKVRIETSSSTRFIWVEQEAPHRVIRAQIGRYTYELTAIE